MAIGPIDYTSMQTQLDVSPLLQGLQVRDQRRQFEAVQKRQDQQAAIVATKEHERESRERAWELGIQGVMANPTTEGYSKLALQFPDHVAAIKAASDSQTAGQRTRNVQAAMTLGGLINNGMTDRALTFLTERKGALAEGGESTEVTEDLIAALKSGDTTRAKAVAGLVISATLGEGAGDVLDTLGYSEKAKRDAAKEKRDENRDARDERRLDQNDRRIENSERATNAAIAGRARDDARADRKATGGGKGRAPKLPSGFILD